MVYFIVDQSIKIQEFLDNVILIQIGLEFDQILVDLVQDVPVCVLGPLLLVVALQALILIGYIIQEMLDKFIFQYPFVIQIFPNAIKLELTRLNLAIN